MSQNKLAILLIIIAMFFGTLMLSFLKLAQEDINVYTAGFLRFFFGLLIILPYIIKTNFVVFKTTHFKKHLYKFYVPKFEETLIFLEKKNIKTVIIIQPSYNDLRQDIQSDIIRKLSIQYTGVVLLDLSNKMDISDKKISYDNMHYTRMGNEMAVDFMYEKILNLVKKKL